MAGPWPKWGDVAYRIPRVCPTTYEVPAGDPQLYRTHCAKTFVANAQNIPDMTAMQGALREMRGDAKAMKEETSQRVEALKKELRGTNAQIERIAVVGEETKRAAKEAMEVGKNYKIAPMSYAAAVASDTLTSSTHNPHHTQTASTQSQREIIVNIRNPVTVERLRTMNPRHLKSHNNRALERSAKERDPGKSDQQPRNTRADQFCVLWLEDGSVRPLIAIEYKAPPKPTNEEICTGLQSEIQPERDVIDQEVTDLAFLCRRLLAAVIIQLFS
ncbi:hypothetical protein CKM354_001124600 [Cercospora kikuchii]|uniref:Uncharacterized protein n=1 Tax=Cercospora kikuchii TaxID=84275 RepID=A0A9P3CSL5_9PEZI|nr:uncharacterized protein CKM354_001124600 [Cercospora kikuchii]GIZ48173.1 hypothetical protein CKM354_001124600 [Cercospora kikuchii]